MKKRLTFKCWNCKRTYTLQREITTEQILTVACPYCGEEDVVDLDPYRKPIISAMRDVVLNKQAFGQDLQLPEVIPTRKPE